MYLTTADQLRVINRTGLTSITGIRFGKEIPPVASVIKTVKRKNRHTRRKTSVQHIPSA